MRDKREMTFEELLDELKRMKHQMRNFSAIQKEKKDEAETEGLRAKGIQYTARARIART